MANKIINRKQSTIILHLDDLKVSVDKKYIKDILKILNKKYGQESLLTIECGNILEL